MNIGATFNAAAAPWAKCMEYSDVFEKGREGREPLHRMAVLFETSGGLRHRIVVSCHASKNPDLPPSDERRLELLNEILSAARDWADARERPETFAKETWSQDED